MNEKDVSNVRMMLLACPHATDSEVCAAMNLVQAMDGNSLEARAGAAKQAGVVMIVGDRVSRLLVDWFTRPMDRTFGLAPAVFLAAAGAPDADRMIQLALTAPREEKSQHVAKQLRNLELSV